jgi:hypothetical protein
MSAQTCLREKARLTAETPENAEEKQKAQVSIERGVPARFPHTGLTGNRTVAILEGTIPELSTHSRFIAADWSRDS